MPLRAIPGEPRPHAPQVRRARRRGGVDGLDELDARLVDARGERARHGRLAGARARPTRATSSELWEPRPRRGHAAASTRRRSTSATRRVRPWFCPGRGPRALAPDRRAHRRGPAARAHRLAGADRRRRSSATLNEALAEGRVDVAGVVRRHPGRARSSASGRATARRPGRGRCSRGCSSGCASPASVSTPVRARARSTTTCTRRSRWPTTSSSSARSTSRARARRTPRTCSRSHDAALAERMAAFVDDGPRALPGDRRRRLRRALKPLALRAGAHARDDLVGVVGDGEQVEVGRRDHPVGRPAARASSRSCRAQNAEPTRTTGKWRILPVWMSTQRLEELVERPEAAGEDDERARVAHEHDLAREEVVEAQRDVLVRVGRLLERQLDVQADARQRPASCAPRLAASMIPGPPPVMTAKPASPRRARRSSRASA